MHLESYIQVFANGYLHSKLVKYDKKIVQINTVRITVKKQSKKNFHYQVKYETYTIKFGKIYYLIKYSERVPIIIEIVNMCIITLSILQTIFIQDFDVKDILIVAFIFHHNTKNKDKN